VSSLVQTRFLLNQPWSGGAPVPFQAPTDEEDDIKNLEQDSIEDFSFMKANLYRQQPRPRQGSYRRNAGNLSGFCEKDKKIYVTHSVVEKLSSEFVVTTDRDEMNSFVVSNRLLHVLLDAVPHVVAAFGESSVKTLGIVQDDEGERTLYCLVAFPGTLDEAQRSLDFFDHSWWLNHARAFGLKLNFDFELV